MLQWLKPLAGQPSSRRRLGVGACEAAPAERSCWRCRYQTSAAQYILPELRSDVVELECYPHDGLKFDDDDGDEVRRLLPCLAYCPWMPFFPKQCALSRGTIVIA